MKLTDVPTTYTQLNLVSAVPNADNTGDVIFPQGPAGSNEVTKADIINVRSAAGRRVVLKIGAFGAQFIYDTAPKTAALVTAIQRIVGELGALDGIEFDLTRAAGQNVANLVSVASQLRATGVYGTNFSVGVVVHPNITGLGQYGKLLADALNTAGHLSYVSPQFYDLTTWADPGQVETFLGPWVTAYGSAKVIIQLGASYKAGTEALSEAQAVTLITKLKGLSATAALRGITAENADSDKLAGWTFGTNAGQAMKSTPPPVVAPTAAFNYTPSSVQVNQAVQLTNTSTGTAPMTYQWYFEGSTTVSSTQTNPTYTPATPGAKSIRLVATNSAGFDEENKTGIITATAVPTNPTTEKLPLPAKIISGFHVIYQASPMRVTELPVAYNQVCLFHALPAFDKDDITPQHPYGTANNKGDGSMYLFRSASNRPTYNGWTAKAWESWDGEYDYRGQFTIAELKSLRDRGTRVLLAVGGGNAGYNYTTTTQGDNLYGSVVYIVEVLMGGNCDGITLNNFEADIGSSEFILSSASQRWKARWGVNFSVDSTPHPNSATKPIDKRVVSYMAAQGTMDFVTPQFYEGGGTAAPSFYPNSIDLWQAMWSGTTARVVCGVTYNSSFPGASDDTWSTLAQLQTMYNTRASKIRGFTGWTTQNDRGTSGTTYNFAKTLATHIGAVTTAPGGGTTQPPANTAVSVSAPVLNKTSYVQGETITATVQVSTVGTAFTSPKAVIASRPPGGTHGGGPYTNDFPSFDNVQFPLGNKPFSASRVLTDQTVGQHEFYFAYQNAAGVWQPDGPSTFAAMTAAPGGGGGVDLTKPLPLPARLLAVYFTLFQTGGMRMTALPYGTNGWNQIYVFHTQFNGDGSADNLYGSAWSKSDVATCRARGQRVVLTVGGSGAGFNYQTNAQADKLYDSVVALYTAYGPFDGLDLNCFEGGNIHPKASVFSYLGLKLKALYGNNFSMSCPPAWYSDDDKELCRDWNALGGFDYCAPQIYDAKNNAGNIEYNNAVNFVPGQMAGWLSYVPASKLVYGTGAQYVWCPTTAQNKQIWTAMKNANASYRGVMAWSHFFDNRYAIDPDYPNVANTNWVSKDYFVQQMYPLVITS